MTTHDTKAIRAQMEALTGFTPGPWATNGPMKMEIVGRVHVVLNPENYPAAFVPAWDKPEAGEVDGKDEAITNARLIAAAPDMRETILALCDALDDLRAEVKTLRRQAETLKEGWRISDEGRIEAESENEKLRAALKPFADEAAYWSCHNYTCEDKPVEGFSGYQPVMTCGDLFNARAVLAACKAELGED